MSELDPGGTAGFANETALLQNTASSPGHSVWVSANAGSGKTHVLTQRVIRLMLNGTRPSSILCLTYTKAAASEMSNRVFERLSHWTSLDDEALAREIVTMEGVQPDRIKLAEARKLFARALESPGGLKIQTIHAFCEALLHQFPLEANVAGHFNVLDDKAASVLLAEARRQLLTATQADGDAELTCAFHDALTIADESGLDRLLSDLVANRTAIRRFFASCRDRGGYISALAAGLGLEPDATPASIAAKAWPLAGFTVNDARVYIDLANSKGGSKAQECAYALGLAIREDDPVKRLGLLREGLLKAADEAPYAEGNYATKDMRAREPDLIERLISAAGWLQRVWQDFKTIRLHAATVSALVLGERLIENYEQLKKERSFLDFEDFITRTEALLKKDGIGPWVHYKLDQGIDHILVDEAQDTSPTQWEIIRSLTEEFFAGESARQINRTVFAVGDEKQSIYSFQGARPERFAAERVLTEARARSGGRSFRPINLRVSFRSTEDVLTAVDQVFADPANARGLSALGDGVVHVSNRRGQAGAVDIWETIAEETTHEEDEDWLAPFDRPAERSAAAELARRVAASIEAMVGKDLVVERSGATRLITSGDILVLVRKRDAFAMTLSRELKKGGRVAVAGADRLVLASHIAIQDLMALGRFLILTDDDLSLAALVKSPLLNLDEEALYLLAAERSEAESVWQRLNALAQQASVWAEVLDKLQRWRRMASSLRVHDFYARLLGAESGRRKILARFGSEVSDVLDEFLSFALDHEQTGLPGLASFIATLEEDSPEIKRQQDKARDEVRIMTVHASKGLEAPVVFLVDGGGKPFEKTLLSKLRLLDQGEANPSLPVWYANKDYMCPAVAADDARLELAAEEEYRRLLYVGMTRASDRLILASFRKKREVEGTWAKLTSAALTMDGERCKPAVFRAGHLEWQGWTWRHTPERMLAPAIEPEPVVRRSIAPPASLYHPLPPMADLPRPLAPSGVHTVIDETSGDEIVGSLLFRDRQTTPEAQMRGKIIHRLLQTLPEFEAEEREDAARRYLDRAATHWAEDDKDLLIDQVSTILSDPQLAFLHEKDTQAEVSLMGEVKVRGRSYAVSGRIDRMGRIDDGIFILDYKTNLSPPAKRKDIPFAHRGQLALYRRVLESIFPGKKLTCLLLYTEGPHLFALSDEEVEKALLDISVG